MFIRRRASLARVSLARVAAIAASAVMCACSSSTNSGSTPTASPSTSASGQVQSSSRYPNALVVLGHSGTTGADSDPSSPGTDAKQSSWATGDNPAVNSIYTRLLALNPAVRGHNTNLGVDGSDTEALGAQVEKALALTPLPDLFMIQEVDNDMKCDGTDPDNYPRFAQTLSGLLRKITTQRTKAMILLVSSPPGTVQKYGGIVSHSLAGKTANTGTGPCDMFDPSGKAVLAHWRYQEQVIQHYHAELDRVCKQFPTCRYDGGALYRLAITAADLAPDGLHLTIAGHRKQAALEWRVLALDS